jgi:peptidoglycan hydrolase-like protein with peptidoglycan-binding domain
MENIGLAVLNDLQQVAGQKYGLFGVAAALMYSYAAQAARHGASRASPPTLDAQTINAAQPPTTSGKKRASAPGTAALIKEKILLDRAGVSPGEMDGQAGSNDQKALAAFQEANGLKPTGRLDAETWDRLTATSSEPALM